MNASLSRVIAAMSLLVATVLTTSVLADPLPGRDLLKFSQEPMVATQIPHLDGTVHVYQGHDELSTAYGFPQGPPPTLPAFYQGRFMADDFADNFNSPVVHVKWWGSYLDAQGPQNPQMPVDKFLIAFESDIPADPNDPFPYSRPGTPLLTQVVNRGALAAGSGTFTESLVRGPDPILGESLYEYNAELHLGKEFFQKADTVYWLKIVAMVDVPAGITFDPFNPPNNAAFPVTRWGWHNRDYTIQDTLASPNVSPGEFIEGFVEGTTHFQDDSVQGDVRIHTQGLGTPLMPFIDQANMFPQKYIDGVDGPGMGSIPGTQNIGSFSKDLAFKLYTIQVPEPGTCLMLLIGCIGVCGVGRRTRG